MPDVVIFFIRGFNGLDHMTPIIYGLRQDHPRVVCKCVLTDFTLSLTHWQIEYLKTLKVEVLSIVEVSGWSAEAANTVHFSTEYVPSVFQKIKNRLNGRSLKRERAVRLLDSINAETTIKKIIRGYANPILIFDFDHRELTRRLINQAKKIGIRTIGVPHGVTLGRGFELLSDEVNTKIYPSVQPSFPVDEAFVANHFERKLTLARGAISPDRLAVIGSPRFSDEWVAIRDRLVVRANFAPPTTENLKVAFFATKPEGRCDVEKTKQVLEAIAGLPGVTLLVKGHTRGPIFSYLESSRWDTCGSEIDSSLIIQWADLALFTHSSIILESVSKNKTVGFLKFITIGRVVHEKVDMSWELNSVDQARQFILRLCEDRHLRTYSERQRHEFVRQFISPFGGGSIERAVGGILRSRLTTNPKNL